MNRLFNIFRKRINTEVNPDCPCQFSLRSSYFSILISPLISIFHGNSDEVPETSRRIQDLISCNVLCKREQERIARKLAIELIAARHIVHYAHIFYHANRPKTDDFHCAFDKLFIDGKPLFIDEFFEFLFPEKKLKNQCQRNTGQCGNCADERCEYRNNI